MLDFARKPTIPSAVSYAAWKLAKKDGPVNLRLRSGPRFQIRSSTSGNNDFGVAYEIFVHEYYKDRSKLVPDDVRLIVDLGSNVGYSLIYFLHTYPNSRIIAFEPHPWHSGQIENNLILDGSKDRVELHAKAAGAQARQMRLTNGRSASTLTDKLEDTFAVEVVDIFSLLDNKRIDILKMDIEGGEYEILADSRFSNLDIRAIIMEWHSRGGGITDKKWCEDQLASLGFATKEIFTQPKHGMFWATRALTG